MSEHEAEEEAREGDETPVGELILQLLADYNLLDEVRRYRVMTEWLDIVGPRVAARTWPTPIAEGILLVKVLNSSWLHELSFMRDQIRASVNQHLGSPPLVKDVRLLLGRRHEDGFEPHTGGRYRMFRRRRLRTPPATGAQLAAIDAETACIEDDELRAVVREARRRLGQ